MYSGALDLLRQPSRRFNGKRSYRPSVGPSLIFRGADGVKPRAPLELCLLSPMVYHVRARSRWLCDMFLRTLSSLILARSSHEEAILDLGSNALTLGSRQEGQEVVQEEAQVRENAQGSGNHPATCRRGNGYHNVVVGGRVIG